MINDWNFSRPELADKYLSMLDLGFYNNIAIIAPRRKGKTLFMLQDIAPIAKKRNYVPVYANLWQNINAPQEGLISAFQEALSVAGNQSRLKKLLTSKVKKTSVSNELLGKMEIEFAEAPAAATNKDLALLESLITELQKKIGDKTILLLVDEVQHLATSSVFDPVTFSLRTLIDKRQGKIKSIFTGSSRHYMDLLFNQPNAAFYHFVERVPFPDLGQEFLEFIQQKLDTEHGISLTVEVLEEAFVQFDRSPYWMLKLVGHLVTFGPDWNESLNYILSVIVQTEGFESLSKKMKLVDKIVYLALSDDENIYSKAFLANMSEATGLKPITANVQRSVERLKKNYLISVSGKNEYHIEKSGFASFLRSADKSLKK